MFCFFFFFFCPCHPSLLSFQHFRWDMEERMRLQRAANICNSACTKRILKSLVSSLHGTHDCLVNRLQY
uniref:Putative secreted protein n=1 Tax=Rhipicephalus microplus TaxID=6941 RepID=A0A6M2DEN8_RHIMP